MTIATTKLTKGAFRSKEAAKRAALTKGVVNMKLAVKKCQTSMVERVKSMEVEIASFKKEVVAAEGRLAEFEDAVSKASK